MKLKFMLLAKAKLYCLLCFKLNEIVFVETAMVSKQVT